MTAGRRSIPGDEALTQAVLPKTIFQSPGPPTPGPRFPAPSPQQPPHIGDNKA
jgi:hypothetical protein